MSKKAVIILLVLCALLFVLALGGNWLPSAQISKENFNPESSRWLSKLDEWLSPLEKKVSLSRLKPSGCKELAQGRYLLASGGTCTIGIDSLTPPEEGHRVLLVGARPAVVFHVPKPPDMPCPDETRSRGLKAGTMVLNPAVARIKTVPAVRLPGKVIETPASQVVKLDFSPAGSSRQTDNYPCVQKPPVKLAVFSKGGELRLTCSSCSANRKVELVIE
ncbi:MAG TPA: hypothetical protein ENJ12_07135 [Thiolapillus brandeum]|uniref:Uncharacterized protein n=1 Tax=Thiolapillus brandeum TaxID=1076588 RepID=A0A831RV45_9GAMM|nr:hypothetical protein [Thiolapillus brandeum]